MPMKYYWHSVIFLFLFCLVHPTFAQSGPEAYLLPNLPKEEKMQVVEEAAEAKAKPAATDGLEIADKLVMEYRMTQERYRFYEVMMLAFVAVFSLVVALTFIRNRPNCQPRDMVNITGLILVIFSTIIVILLADVEVQLTAAMGVLGGIAGYLFGTFNAPRRTEKDEEKEKEKQPVSKKPEHA
jgi:membrane protein YqaA with SNARE-associated domain